MPKVLRTVVTSVSDHDNVTSLSDVTLVSESVSLLVNLATVKPQLLKN